MEAMAKRARVCDAPRDGIVRLNVGGTVLHTTRETLSGNSEFFASLLDFDGGDKDADGNIFVDRSGKLFCILLESWRKNIRPPQSIVNVWKQQLLEECKFSLRTTRSPELWGEPATQTCRRHAGASRWTRGR